LSRITKVHRLLTSIWRLEGAWRYVLPFAFYVSAGTITRILFIGLDEYHVYIAYAMRTAVVGYILFKSINRFSELSKKYRKLDCTALLTGVAIFILWVGLEGHYPTFFSPDSYYDPTIFSTSMAVFLILIRLLGSVFVAPLIEELFIRSFLIRYIIDLKWEDVPIGKYTFESFLIVTLVFGFSHFQWLPGILTAVLLNLLLYKKKRVFPCIVAHALANLLLFIYVVYTNSWFFF
jgi:CAAX protease family protein